MDLNEAGKVEKQIRRVAVKLTNALTNVDMTNRKADQLSLLLNELLDIANRLAALRQDLNEGRR